MTSLGGSPNPLSARGAPGPLPPPWSAWPPPGVALPLPLPLPPAPPPPSTSSRQDTPQLPQLGRRRSSLLAGLGSLGHGGHRAHQALNLGVGLGLGPVLPGADAAAAPAVSRRRSLAKQRRDEPPVGVSSVSALQSSSPESQDRQDPQPPARSSALFSPYSPLPAIGAPLSFPSASSSMRSDTPACDPAAPVAPVRLLRERTYDVLEPRFVRGPVCPSLPSLTPGSIGTDPLNGSSAVPGMIEDEVLPTSPPGMDDEDFSSVEFTDNLRDESSTATSVGEGSVDLVLAGTTLGPLEEPSLGRSGSRSLHALTEGYKGKLKKFWSKF